MGLYNAPTDSNVFKICLLNTLVLHFNTKIKIDTLHIISRELIDREMFHIFKENLKTQLSVFLVIEEGEFYY